MTTFGSSIDGAATKTDVYSAFTTEQITAITVFHSGGNNA